MKSKPKVFIAGSRRLSRLGADVWRRIDNIIEKGFTVLIGDANGVDKAVQQYLVARHYSAVIVFCMEDGCRNNAGGWTTRVVVSPDASRHDFAHFSTKDREMVREADYGLMLWDGRSRGTLTSTIGLVRKGKPVVVYLAPEKSFHEVRDSRQLGEVLKRVDPSVLEVLDGDLQSFAMDSHGSRVGASRLF
jgi:nucleoside 2-deoxyribosyltransferase